jgi:hypothetical protein
VRQLLTRVNRLETRITVGQQSFKIRFGDLKRLPPDYKGERHVIITRQLPDRGGNEWVEFQEVPGPEPNAPQPTPLGSARALERRLDIRFVEAYPWSDDAGGR